MASDATVIDPDRVGKQASRPPRRERWQWPLWRLMVLTTGLALTFAAWRAQVMMAVPALAATLLATFGPPPNPRGRSLFGAFLVLIALALPAEWLAAEVALETIGEVDSALRLLVILLNVVPIALFAAGWYRTGFALALAIFLLIVPEQVLLGHRWALLQQEASRIVSYAYQAKVQDGDYPADLSGYRPRYERLADHFDYRRDPKSGAFSLFYYVGTMGTSHWYKSAPDPNEGWGYYPD